MNQGTSIQEDLVKTFPQWVHSKASVQDFSQLVVDSEALLQDLERLRDTSKRITNSIHGLVQSLLEQG